MELGAAFTEFLYAKDHSPASKAWYTSRLGVFMRWAQDQGVTDIDDVTAPPVGRYIDEWLSRLGRLSHSTRTPSMGMCAPFEPGSAGLRQRT